MSAPQVVGLVFGILALVALIQAAIWIPIIRRAKRIPGELANELAATGQSVYRGPERGVYRGSSSAAYPHVKGNAYVVLTDAKLIFRKYVGASAHVDLQDLRGVRLERVFLASVVAGRLHVVVQVADGGEVGFFAADPEGWQQAIEGAIARRTANAG